MVRSVLAFALVALAATPASAKREIDFFDAGDFRPEPCTTGKTWPELQKCLTKTMGAVTVLKQSDKYKLVSVADKHDPKTKRVFLYANTEKKWFRSNLGIWLGPSNDMRHVESFGYSGGTGLRLDVSTSVRTLVSLDQVTSQRGVLRQNVANVCLPPSWTCQTVVTDCEVYVRDKVFFAFHGELVWHPSLGLRLKGTSSTMGGSCVVSPSMLIDGDT